MANLVESVMPREARPPVPSTPLRSVQPSLLDLRFTGDPWMVDQRDGTITLRLDDYRLARIHASPFDVPSLNQLVLQLRQSQLRRKLYQQLQLRIRARGSV